MKTPSLFKWVLPVIFMLNGGSAVHAQLCPTFSSAYSGLPGLSNGSIAWGDFDNDGKLDILLTGKADQNSDAPISQVWKNVEEGLFANINAGLPGVAYGSVAWGDFDNDGKLDILLTGKTNQNLNSAITQIWRNVGDGTFTNINAGLPGVAYGSVAWGDYDNDGKLDILLTGLDTSGNAICQIWRNLGNGTFTNINAGMPGVYLSSVAWGDFDNDGNLDILVTGLLDSGFPVSRIWQNLGGGIFLQIDAGFAGVDQGAVAWGDFDNDGRLDVLLTGIDETGNAVSGIWWNAGSGTFYDINAGLPGVWQSSVAWGDFDNDGGLDILLMGYTNNPVSNPNNSPIFQVWRNQNNWTFANIGAGLPEVLNGIATWGDYNGDGKLDVFLNGNLRNNPIPISQIWRNDTLLANSSPVAPSNLTATIMDSGVILNWSPAADNQTPVPALSYNVRVGTTPGGVDILAPQSDALSGLRRLPQIGNGQQRLSTIITNLPAGTYFWSVQAVDSVFDASPFADEASFTLGPPVIVGWGVQPDGNFRLRAGGATSSIYLIEVSTNLVDWTYFTYVFMGSNGQSEFIEVDASSYPAQYYRLVQP
ncbi:FG-GAP repeat domain-containing protein [Pedosphaera parvula]|uniref:Fibronectin type III domain protein n=1 Tax=Pedosphaera parvula (strain Ellin514) TaxID=320771 RepID=B9XAW1_PEDPL|nr:VCBS repeat-containing protein [Pedosphaera parvula]EEF63146.1 Fibronectin type III domain protein [Pedosphaera parvula Ellin514]